MNDTHTHIVAKDEPLPDLLPECPAFGKPVVSPLGWSIKSRLVCATAAAALLWLSVAWAIGWPK
jgi:hypothetical protein